MTACHTIIWCIPPHFINSQDNYPEKKMTKVKFYPEKRTKVTFFIESAEFSIKLDYKLNIPWYCS